MIGVQRLSLHIFAAVSFSFASSVAIAQQSIALLKNGMQLGPGTLGERASLNMKSTSTPREGGEIQAKPILFLDDELRITYFHKSKLANAPPLSFDPMRIIMPNDTKRASPRTHNALGVLGNTVGLTPFDEYGRRVFSTQTQKGMKDIIQGITEISANYVKVESLESESAVVWDMRLALSSVPRKTLMEILKKNAETGKPQDWLDVVSMLIEAQRFADAKEFLEKAIRANPSLENQRPQLQVIDQREAEQMFREVQTRQAAGQNELAELLLRQCDVKKLSDETRLKVAGRIRKIEEDKKRYEDTIKQIREQLAQLTDPALIEQLKPVVDEIGSHLNSETIVWLADYIRLKDDQSLTVDQRLALALGGWLFGTGSGQDNISIVRSAIEARPLVQEYLSRAPAGRREGLIDALRSLEAGTPKLLSQLIRQMTPPQELPAPVEGLPGRYRVDIPSNNGNESEPISYLVQTPPEYDPYRKYPCVVALHSDYMTVEKELEWWTGKYDERFKQPLGEASRHGFVVVAPLWARPKQREYEYTENEHHRVLACLRDAFRKISIDTDRVFISGHQSGGTTAWDIAISHPDIWAGLVCISGNSSGFTKQYKNNARYFPIYYVGGDMEGPESPLVRNGEILDDYVRLHPDCMVTMYRGRGKDHFQEELPRIIEWMKLANHVRSNVPADIAVKTTRPGDNFFWPLEITGFPVEKTNNPFLDFDHKRVMDINISRTRNGIQIEGLIASEFELWFSPDMIDFGQEVLVAWQKNRKRLNISPDIAVLLEDVRRRGDRQRPFWGKVTLP